MKSATGSRSAFAGRNRFILSCLCLAVLLAAFGLISVHGESIITEEDYWQLVETSIQKIDLADREPDQQQAILHDLAGQWADVKRVELFDGSIQVVHSGMLVELIKDTHPDLKYIRRLLITMQESRSREVLLTFSTEDTASIREILAQPEYDWTEKKENNPFQQWLDDLRIKIGEFLSDFFPKIEFSGVIDLRPLFTIAVALIMLALFYFGFRDVFRELVEESSLKEDGEDDEDLTASQAMQNAQKSADSGDHRLAVRYLYLSTLLFLEERGLLRYDRSLTNREYLNRIQNHPAQASTLRNIVDVFDRVWYGYRNIDNDTFQEYVEQVNRLKEKEKK